MNFVRKKARLFVLLFAVATVKTASADGRVLLKPLNEELLDHAQEKMDLHTALGHKHPSMTNSLLRSKEMDQILNDGDYRAVGGNRGDGSGKEEKVDKKASKTPKALTKHPTAAPASPGADELPSKGSSTKRSEPKTLGSGDKGSKEKKGKKGESGGTMENEEDNSQEEEQEELPGSGDANATQINQEEAFSEHTIERSLGVSAFLFETHLTILPDSDDYVELLVITDSIMRDIFDWFFKGVSDVMYGYTKVDGCKALAPFLVQCSVNLFFSDQGYLPSSEELTEIAVQELKDDKNFHLEYLTRLHAMKAQAFAAATDVVYISTQDDMDAALLAENTLTNSKSKDASRLVTLVLPLVMVSVLFLLVGFFIFRIRRSQRHWEHILDPNENIMKHKDRDLEEGTTTGETYHISAFSEDATVTSDHFHAGNKKKHTKEILDKQMEQMIHDLEEVSLASSTSRISEKDSEDSDDNSMSATPRSQQQNKTMTLALDHSSKPAWATRGSTSHSVVSRESSSGWTSKAESTASTMPAIQAKKPFVDQNGDNLVRFKNPDSPMLGETTESIVAPSNSPNCEKVADSSYTLNAKQAFTLPVLKRDQVANNIDTKEFVAEISSEIITSTADQQIDQEEPSAISDKKVEIASSWVVEKLTDGPDIDSTKTVQLATNAKLSTPRTNKATAPAATASVEAKMNQPDWTKARLRHVPKPAIIGTDEHGSKESAPSSPQPEWMMKFKQMGLDKQLEDD